MRVNYIYIHSLFMNSVVDNLTIYKNLFVTTKPILTDLSQAFMLFEFPNVQILSDVRKVMHRLVLAQLL